MNVNQRRAAQLGMPYGTACGRLRKNVLFRLLQKHNEDICVRCSKRIESVDDLSLEHVKPWENRDASLFWDLDNIAFSHIHCNTPHEVNSGGLPMIMPEGMSRCVKHKQFFPVERFSKNRDARHGLCWYCKDCQHYNRSSPRQ